MTTIYLVRHGKTDLTGQRIIGNTPGVLLNETGRSQAGRVADYLQQFPIEAIYSIPMERATETAFPLAKKLNLPVNPMEFLREINFGDLQGKGEELKNLPVWQQFLAHPAEVQFPNGESVREAQERVVSGLGELSKQFAPTSQIACFAHCEILRLVIAFALHMPLDDFIRLTILPASVSCLEWEDNVQRLIKLNNIP